MATKKRGTLSQYAKTYPKNLQQQVVGQTGYMVPVDSTMHEFNDTEKDAYIKSMFGGQSPNPSGVIRNVGNRSMNVDTTNSIFPKGGYAGGGGVNSDEYTGDADQDVPGYVNPGGAKTNYNTPSSTALQKAMSFGEAFSQARKSGAKDFSWNGKKFTTNLKSNTTSSAPRANTVVPVSVREMVSPQAQQQRALEERAKKSYTLPEAEIVADRTRYDMSPALRPSEVNRVLNKNRIANFPQLPAYAGALANIPKKKRGGLTTYVKNNYNG